jgi:phosphonate transport system ATP-binding protein
MYRLQHVRKVFADGTAAVDDVSLTIRQGERVAVIGPSGAGKTTLFRLLNATLRPTSGRLWFDEVDLESLSGRRLRQLRRRIGTVYQRHNLVPQLRVIHNVLAGRLGRWTLPKALLSLMSPQERAVALMALERVGIPEKFYSRTAYLSGGQQQRVAIARVLVQDPDVILADEPVSSVDPTEALHAAGAGKSALLLYGFLPQVFANMVSYSLYRWECAIRSAAILGLVGAGGLGQQIELSMRMFEYRETSTILIIVFVLVTGVDHLSTMIRKAL